MRHPPINTSKESERETDNCMHGAGREFYVSSFDEKGQKEGSPVKSKRAVPEPVVSEPNPLDIYSQRTWQNWTLA
jgi:hypothetical protein